MSYKAILAGISGGTAAPGTIEAACRLGRQFGASIEGFHVKIDPIQVLSSSFGVIGMPLPTDWIDDLTREAAATAEQAKIHFLAALERHKIELSSAAHLPPAAARWHDRPGDASALLAARGRFFDLIVLGRSERVMGNPYSDAIETIVLRSGRPVLIAPATLPATLGDRIAIGWNGSVESVKAVAAALPLLTSAYTTTILTIDADDETGVASLMRYLELHNIKAEHQSLRSEKGVESGERLIMTATDIGADMLVLGGYGHMPWREALFGGATRSVLRLSELPIFLSH